MCEYDISTIKRDFASELFKHAECIICPFERRCEAVMIITGKTLCNPDNELYFGAAFDGKYRAKQPHNFNFRNEQKDYEMPDEEADAIIRDLMEK